MNTNLSDSSHLPVNLQPETRPSINQIDYKGLPREERLFHALMYPRYFTMTAPDESYFDLCKLAYNILFSAPTDMQARTMIAEIRPGVKLDHAEVTELIRVTKYLFGKIQSRDADFDRDMLRNQLLDLIQRCKIAGDLENERRAYKQLADLENLALKESKYHAPVIPPLPNVNYFVKPAPQIGDAAIIESSPDEEE